MIPFSSNCSDKNYSLLPEDLRDLNLDTKIMRVPLHKSDKMTAPLTGMKTFLKLYFYFGLHSIRQLLEMTLIEGPSAYSTIELVTASFTELHIKQMLLPYFTETMLPTFHE